MPLESIMSHIHNSEPFAYDAVEKAEAVLGAESPGVSHLAMVLSMANSLKRRSAAIDAGDTMFNDSMARARGVIERCGFKQIGGFDILCSETQTPDVVEIYTHPDVHCVATLESYEQKSVNTSTTYFVSPYAERRLAEGLGWSGSFESASVPDWRRQFQCATQPEDLLLVANYHSLECFASKFKHLQECRPVARPVNAAFSIVEQVFLTGRDYQAQNTRYEAKAEHEQPSYAEKWKELQALALCRLKATGLPIEFFGGMPRTFSQ